MTDEKKLAIYYDYTEAKLPTREIVKKYSLSGHTLTKIITELGGAPRRPKACGERSKGKTPACPKCGRRIEVKGAKYCPFCGADIRTREALLIERLDAVISDTMLLPDGRRTKARDALLAAINYITEKEVK